MRTTINTAAGIEFERIDNDVNGNPRYVCSYFNLLSKEQNGYHDGAQYINGTVNFHDRYRVAIKTANKIGGKKYHNKQYGGGIVFQSYNIEETARRIKELVNAN